MLSANNPIRNSPPAITPIINDDIITAITIKAPDARASMTKAAMPISPSDRPINALFFQIDRNVRADSLTALIGFRSSLSIISGMANIEATPQVAPVSQTSIFPAIGSRSSSILSTRPIVACRALKLISPGMRALAAPILSLNVGFSPSKRRNAVCEIAPA